MGFYDGLIIGLLAANILWMMKVLRDISYRFELTKLQLGHLEKQLWGCENEIRINTNECFRGVKIEILALQADILRSIKPQPTPDKKMPTTVAANRNSRTEEQRKIASDKKKAWWAEKRRKEKAKAPS